MTASNFFGPEDVGMVDSHPSRETYVVEGDFVQMRWAKELEKVLDIEGCIVRVGMRQIGLCNHLGSKKDLPEKTRQHPVKQVFNDRTRRNKAIDNTGYSKENQQDDSSGGKKLPLLCAKKELWICVAYACLGHS
jgi:hypothetical protein